MLFCVLRLQARKKNQEYCVDREFCASVYQVETKSRFSDRPVLCENCFAFAWCILFEDNNLRKRCRLKQRLVNVC